MKGIEIPAIQWQEFCESFTRQHHGWLVNMCRLDTRAMERNEAPEQEAVRLFPVNRPLQEVRQRQNGDQAEIIVTAGTGKDETSVLIEDAIALFSLRNGDVHHGLRIDSRSGATTLIKFRAAADPEALDGLAASEL